MNKSNWKYLLPIFFICNILVNINLFFKKNKIDVYNNTDEAWYGIVLENIAQYGCPLGVPVTFLKSETKNFHTCLFFKILNKITPFEDFAKKAIYLKVLARALTLLVLGLFSYLFFKNVLWGIGFAVIYFLDIGFGGLLPIFKSILSLLNNSFEPLIRTNRFISPLHYSLPGLFCLYFFIKSSKEQFLSNLAIIFSLLCMFLMAIIPFYAWIPYHFFLLCIVFYSFLFHRDGSVWKKLLAIQFLGFLFILFYLKTKLGMPFQEEALLRSSFFKNDFSPIYIFFKSFIFSLCFLFFVLYKKTKSYLFAGVVCVGCYLLMNLNILTGYEYQNFHFKDYLSLPIYFTIFLFIGHSYRQYKKALAGLLVGLIFLLTLNSIKSNIKSVSQLSQLTSVEENLDVLNYMALNIFNQKIYCGQLYNLIPLYTKNRCFYHHLLMTYPIDDEELLDINVVYFGILNYDRKKMLQVFANDRKEKTLATYSYGVKKAWIKNTPPNQRYTKKLNILKLQRNWLDYYALNFTALLPKFLNKFDYMVIPNTTTQVYPSFSLEKQFKNFKLLKKLR